MIMVETYKYYCEYCGGTGWSTMEYEVKTPTLDVFIINKDEQSEMRCQYCGNIVTKTEQIDTRIYKELADYE